MCVCVCVCVCVFSCDGHIGEKLTVMKRLWLSVYAEMDPVTRVQTLDEADYISHATNTLGKGMNEITLHPAMGK